MTIRPRFWASHLHREIGLHLAKDHPQNVPHPHHQETMVLIRTDLHPRFILVKTPVTHKKKYRL
jgi:hypothetical protein